jgi:flavin reductase (DIM6/NTAB) family NADH-FMN oxidoreductase RutF
VAETAVPVRFSVDAPPPAGQNGRADAVRLSDTRDTRDGKALRRGFGAFPTGVAALAALVDGEPVGMAVSSFTSVSLDPPLVSVCAATTSRTWRSLRPAARLGISVLSAAQEHACGRLAARDTDRFAGLPWYATPDGAVLLGEACAWFECAVERSVRAGDHEIIVLRVHRFDVDPQLPPLVFHGSRFRRLAE